MVEWLMVELSMERSQLAISMEFFGRIKSIRRLYLHMHIQYHLGMVGIEILVRLGLGKKHL
jgi:hypothetical protein